MLRTIKYKGVYKSDQDNILKDFYFPMLGVANRYDRAVGFFSASTISYAAQALSIFVKNDGKIRLILGAFTDAKDLEAIKLGYEKRGRISDLIANEFLEGISDVNDELFHNRFDTLCWLVAHGRLSIKIALRERGMFHDKVGIVSDGIDDKVVFAGSANESTYALLPTHNYESINVFRSWIPEHAEFYNPHIDSFERLWCDDSGGTVVIDVPEAVQDKLVRVANSLDYTPDPEIEAEIAHRIHQKGHVGENSKPGVPCLPRALNGKRFELRKHQIDALNAWKSQGDFHGVLDLATGAGKTITAIYAIVKVSERSKSFTCVVAVPYQNLADQWVDTLATFNIYPVRCYVSYSLWKEKMDKLAYDNKMGEKKFNAIVVVNRTLKDPRFQRCLKKLNGENMLWIGDECHHHTTESYEGFLPTQARFRIGLSATPEHYIDDERNERLNRYYGDVVYKYSLNQAIQDKVLTPYEYFPHLVELTDEESEEFVDLSNRIGQIYAKQNDLNKVNSTQLQHLLMRRSRLIGSASNKKQVLEEVITKKRPAKHTLFYCGDGSVSPTAEDDATIKNGDEIVRQIESVCVLLDKFSWNVSRFTSDESRRDRENILRNFGLGNIDALVAIKCLDEGIDIPACSTAYILASSRDPRQFVQRRGRILRRSPGKDLARIHDFIVILPGRRDADSEYGRKLIRSELARVVEFSSLSENSHDSYKVLSPVLKEYGLEHLV
ncbi:MAG: DEAD/DEAH box helicase [Candidatus Dadabacteria bacterium]|nr:DEAD/DEAH box helicase [Candidatus Dadabacteria bacterium]